MEALILIEFLILGVICGVFSSTPPGPINLLIADSVLGGKKINIKSFLGGIILIDMIFALIAIWGYYTFLEGTNFGYYLAIFGGLLLMILGAFGLKQTLNPEVDKKTDDRFSNTTFFLKGILLMVSNPGFLAFWVIVANQIDQIALHEITTLRTFPFLIGIGLGDLIWFILFIRLLRFGAGKMSFNIIGKTRLGISVLMILLGGFTMIKTLLG